ncbi:MAG: hypothetical protein ACI9S8_001671 [Chlamydiales bacterium]|jgi:hypothetical protein
MAVTMLMNMNFTEYNRTIACAFGAFGESVEVGIPESDTKWRSVLSMASKVAQLAAGIMMCQEALWVKDFDFVGGAVVATLVSTSLVLSLKGLDHLTAGKGFNRYVKLVDKQIGNLGQVAFFASTIALLVLEVAVSQVALASLGINVLYCVGKVGRIYLEKCEERPPQTLIPVDERPCFSDYDSSGEEEAEGVLQLDGTSLDARNVNVSLSDFLSFLQEHPEIQSLELPKCFIQELQERDVRKIFVKLPNIQQVNIDSDGEKKELIERYLRGYMQLVAIQAKLHESTELDISQSDISLDQFNDLINRRNKERIKHLEHLQAFPERIASKFTERDLRKALLRLSGLKTIDLAGCDKLTPQIMEGVQASFSKVKFFLKVEAHSQGSAQS